MPRAKPRLAILISGRGSNMVALAKAAAAPDFPATLALVAANKPEAEGLAVAAAMGHDVLAIPSRGKSREAFEAELDSALTRHRIDVIALAGFMRILTPGFLRRWEGRILNIHPSLLPRYQGLDTHARALAAGDAEAGCTVHIVTALLDNGPILAQARVPILPGDSEQSLAARVLAEEHRIYPKALAAFCASLPARN